jgi:hypothetical protein
MKMNKRQTCAFFGWTLHEFDQNLRQGFPARKNSSSRGADWAVDSVDAIKWVATRKAAEAKSPVAPEPERPLPAGIKPAARLKHPTMQGFMFGHLDAVYSLPRLVACMAAEAGLPMGKVHELAVGITFALIDHIDREAREAGLEPWAGNSEQELYDLWAFPEINWPNLANIVGEPEWKPPYYGMGWYEYSPEGRKANIRKNSDAAA